MNVERISATIRISRQCPDGTWGTVELGAEASVTDSGSWKEEQAQLYLQLKTQLRTLWQERQPTITDAPNGRRVDTDTGEISPGPEVCPDHGKAKPSTKHSGVYCPDKLPDGKYCKWESK